MPRHSTGFTSWQISFGVILNPHPCCRLLDIVKKPQIPRTAKEELKSELIATSVTKTTIDINAN